MTPEAQRIAIVKACPNLFKWYLGGVFWTLQSRRIGPTNILDDLNAMHEAEAMLTTEQKDRYIELLTEMFSGPDWRFYLINATAPQRAEAFLKTIGKWEEAK